MQEFAKLQRGIGLVLVFCGVLCSCASSFKVTSEPLQADVFVLDSKTGNKKQLGKTPLELPTATVKAALGDEAQAGEYFSMLVEKEGFVAEKLLVPASRFGTLITSVDVKLKQGNGPKEEIQAKEILDHLFLAQSFAKNKEFERAQIELDKVLSGNPLFPRALSMKGSIYFMQKNYPESLKWFEKALSVDPQMQDAVKMTAKIHAMQGGSKGLAVKGSSKAR